MKRVRQQHESGCVPACIAMLADISYASSIRLFEKLKIGSHKSFTVWGTTHKQMLKGMQYAGLNPFDRQRKTSLAKLKHNAILVIEHEVYGEPHERTHAVVWDVKKQRVLDPYVGRGSLKRHLSTKIYEESLLYIVESR